MPRTINLLPWREQLRSERRRGFCAGLLGVSVIAAAVVLLIDRELRSHILEQRHRNDQLRNEVRAMESGLEELSLLREQARALAGKLAALQRLQDQPPAAMRLFEEVVRAAPQDVRLELLQRQDGKLLLEGVASSSTAVAEFMRRLRAEWRLQPALQRISAVGSPAPEEGLAIHSVFVLTVDTAQPPDPSASSGEAAVAGGEG